MPGTTLMQSLFDGVAAYIGALSPREMAWIAIGYVGESLRMN